MLGKTVTLKLSEDQVSIIKDLARVGSVASDRTVSFKEVVDKLIQKGIDNSEELFKWER